MNRPPRLEVIAIGNEMLLGKRIDTNTAYLGRRLAELDLAIALKITVGDAEPELSNTVRAAWERADAVITCGGLGPTVDDVTREALVAATGIALREDAAVLAAIEARFQRRGVPMPPNNRCQALVPVHGGWFPNAHGTAPGLYFETADKCLLALPGPPNEFRPLVDDAVLAYLARRFPAQGCWIRSTLRFAGIPESTIDAFLRPWLARDPGIEASLLPSLGIIEVTLSRRGALDATHDAGIETITRALRDHFGAAIFAEGDETLPAVVGRLLRESGRTLAVAESCTGGLISAEVTSIAGSSDYFVAGMATYANRAKQSLLGVRAATLEEYGAVSVETAVEMAEGARARCHADVGLAVTGIAGPTGGSATKPVGTVCMAAVDGVRTVEGMHRYVGDRDEIRRRATVGALALLYRLLRGGG